MSERRSCRRETDFFMKGRNRFVMDRLARARSSSRHVKRSKNGRRCSEMEERTSPASEDLIRERMWAAVLDVIVLLKILVSRRYRGFLIYIPPKSVGVTQNNCSKFGIRYKNSSLFFLTVFYSFIGEGPLERNSTEVKQIGPTKAQTIHKLY